MSKMKGRNGKAVEYYMHDLDSGMQTLCLF